MCLKKHICPICLQYDYYIKCENCHYKSCKNCAYKITISSNTCPSCIKKNKYKIGLLDLFIIKLLRSINYYDEINFIASPKESTNEEKYSNKNFFKKQQYLNKKILSFETLIEIFKEYQQKSTYPDTFYINFSNSEINALDIRECDIDYNLEKIKKFARDNNWKFAYKTDIYDNRDGIIFY